MCRPANSRRVSGKALQQLPSARLAELSLPFMKPLGSLTRLFMDAAIAYLGDLANVLDQNASEKDELGSFPPNDVR